MAAIRKGRDAILRFYAAYEQYCTAAVKFAVSFLALYAIHTGYGNSGMLNWIPLTVIAAAFCSFLSPNLPVLFGAAFLEARFWETSPEAAVAGAAVILIWLLLYFSFLQGQGYVVLTVALLLGCGVPFAAPVVCGLLLGPGAAAGICMGTAAYYLAADLGQSGQTSREWSAAMLEQLPERFRTLLLNREMVIMLILLLAVFLTVYLIGRIPAAYSRWIGIASGAIVYGTLTGMKGLLPGGDGLTAVWAADLLLGVLAGFLVCAFRAGPDYGRVERLQFEDDDYYYYVKAVPKKRIGDEMSRKGEERE